MVVLTAHAEELLMIDGSVVCDKNPVLLSDYDVLLEHFESLKENKKKRVLEKVIVHGELLFLDIAMRECVYNVT